MEKANDRTITNPQIIYMWKSPLRAYKKRSSMVIRFYIALTLLLSLITLFFGEPLLIFPIVEIIFLFYTLTTTPPQTTTHKLTKFGIETTGVTVRWDVLSHFYFTKKFDYNILVVVSSAPFFYHLYLVVRDEKTKKELIDLLSDYLIYQEHPQKTFSDKMAEWLTRLMPDASAV